VRPGHPRFPAGWGRPTDSSGGRRRYLHERYPSLDIYARVQTLDEQQALRARGVKHAGTTYLESTLFRGEALLKNMGVTESQAKILIDSLRKDDYQLIKDTFDKTRNVDAQP